MDRQVMPTALRLIAAALLLSLPHTTSAEEDPHDKLVYSRYTRNCQPTAYKLPLREERVQLDHPATLEDVKAGLAIFSFEGLGRAQVAEIPERKSNWQHPRNPFRDPFSRDVTPCQAEELEVDGKWKRYYGVLSAEGAAVVPAEEWEIYWPDAPWVPFQENPFPPVDTPPRVAASNPFAPEGAQVTFADEGELSWALTVQGPKPGFWYRQLGDPLTVTVHFHNGTKHPKEYPSTWYKDEQHGGPAFHDGVFLSLEWTPYDPDYPFLREPVELEPSRTATFAPDGATRTVKPGESWELCSFELRDWFDIRNEGYYVLRVETVLTNSLCTSQFTVGRPPRLPTIEQYNESLPVFGSPENEKRLKKMIREWAERKTAEHKEPIPQKQRPLDWPDPVAGLAARIELIRDRQYWSGGECIVRLKNLSDETLIVPSGNPCDKNATPLFDLYAQHGAGPWRRVKRHYDPYIAAPTGPNMNPYDNPFIDRPWVTLEPGEDCLAVFHAWNEEDCVVADRFKIVLTQPDTSIPERWSGVLETPAFPVQQSSEMPLVPSGCLPFPDHFPLLSHEYRSYVSQAPDTTLVDMLGHANAALIRTLGMYDPADVRREIEQRMKVEKVLPMKLLLASIAASEGSEEAALFLMEELENTDFHAIADTRYALSLVCDRCCHREPPDWKPTKLPAWLIELSLSTLSDQRFVTDFGDPYEDSGYRMTVASCEYYLLLELCNCQCQEIVPTLLEWIENGREDLIEVLGDIGGEQAIAALTEMVRKEPTHSTVVDALCNTRDKRAVPILIEILEEAAATGIQGVHRHPIWVVGQIGDDRAIPVLVKLVEGIDESEAVVEYDDYYHRNQLQPPLSTLAKSLAQLKAKQAVPQLLRFVQYPEVIESLANIGDPAALPALQEIVAAKGKLTRDGQPLTPQLEADRYFAARMALCTWDDDRGAARLLAMLAADDIEEERRHELIEGLASTNHPKTIPALINIIQSARGREDIQTAITALGDLKYKAAANGLIDSFDVDFQEERFGKGGHVTPATYRNRIAQTLQKLTNQSFGNDKQQWLNWWQQKGQHDPNLK